MTSAANSVAEQISVAMRAPGDSGATVMVTITAADAFSTSDPTDMAVLMFWRCAEAADQQPTAESVWHHMVSVGIQGEGGQPLQKQTVQDSVDRLTADDIVRGGESQ